MRRGINIRKRKKILFNKINKKSLKLLSLLSIILIICTFIYFFFIQDIFIKKNTEQGSLDFSSLNENIPFSLQKIILFSSATAKEDSINQLLSLDISQYCDIGIYLNPSRDKNIFISSLYIDNVSLSSTEIGTPCLYKKTVNDFGKCSFTEENIINKRFDFNVIDVENSIDYNNYEVFSNGTAPISLGFYNKNIKVNFISDNSEISYNGTLLKDATIPLGSLKCNISFTINIITTTNEHYICNVNLEVPFEDKNGLIYDTGYVTKEIQNTETNKFIRLK